MLQTNDSNNETVVGGAQLLSTTAQTYTVASLNGVFFFQYKLFTADATLPETASIGLATFDGTGKCKITSKTVSDGKVTTKTQSCTYTVASDGIGSISTGVVFALGGASSGQANGLQFIISGAKDSGNYVFLGGANMQ